MPYSKKINCVIWVVTLAVGVGLGFACLSWYARFWACAPESGEQPYEPAVIHTSVTHVESGSTKPDLLLKSHLFGQSISEGSETGGGAEDQAAAAKAEEPEIDIPLKLIGTIAGNSDNSMAIIEETKQGRQDVYTRGDVLLNAKIEDIHQNEVVLLLAGGVRYVLDSTVPDSAGQKMVKQAVVAPSVVEESIRPDEVVRELSSSDVIINTQARNVAMRKLSRVMDSVSLRAVSESGKKPGVRIAGLPDSMLGRMIGLNNGDVIHKVNGHTVANARKASQVLKKARRLGSAKVQFSRGEKERSLILHTGIW